MEIVFEKVPANEYYAFFKTNTEEDLQNKRWIEIQYDYLKEPSWIGYNTYEIYCPYNISITANKWFEIPTGFKCVSDFKRCVCIPCFDVTEDIQLNKNDVLHHIVLRGIAKENHCFQEGDKLIKLRLGG